MRLLNARAKVSRYRARGSTQSSGTGATSSNNLLVTERSSIELHAERESHSSLSGKVGAAAVSLESLPTATPDTAPRRANHAAVVHTSTNTAHSADHRAPSHGPPPTGRSTNAKP